MTNELEEYIKTYFGIIDAEQLKVISSYFKIEKIRKGDFYLIQGKQSNKMSFVQSGLMRIYADLEDREVTQWISSKGYFITDLSSFVFETPSRWSIEALVDSKVHTISKENYNRIGATVTSWHLLEKLFIVKCFSAMEDRIFSHLSMTAEERYELFFESNKGLFNQVPLKYIASILGMTPETFSRIRKKKLT